MMRYLRAPGLVIVAAGLAAVGWLLMATTFMIHDDEGYVLLSLRNFSEHGRLYDGVFTQYGPFPYLYYDLLHRALDAPIDNLLGRAMAVVHWVGAATLAGLIAWRLADRYWTALFTAAAVFGYLWQMTWEPAHPGGLIAVLGAAGLAAAVEAIRRDRASVALALLGLTGAALMLTKINVGLLWCCATGAFLLLGLPRRTLGVALAATGLALLPWLLMRPLLGEPWVLTLAIMSALSGLAVCAISAVEAPPALRGREWLAGGAALLGLGLVILVAARMHNTSWTGLWHGIVLDPLRHPINFHLGFNWRPLAWLALAASVLLAAGWRWRPALRPQLADVAAGLRLLALAWFVWRLESWISIDGIGGMVSFALPLTPLFLLPLAPGATTDRRWQASLLVALVGMGQVLHAYPIAGSQLTWGSFLLVPLFASGLADAAAHLAGRLGKSWPGWAVAALALVTVGLQTGLLFELGRARWHTSEPAGLRGAEFLRPPENIRYALRILTANTALHADMLHSRPGMFGFNLWSGVPTPTLRNATHWFWLLSPAEQADIIRQLGRAARPAVISSQPLLAFLRDEAGMTVAGPLNEHIDQAYRKLFSVSGYDFLVPRDSRAAPFYVAQNFELRSDVPHLEPRLITVNVALRATVARVVLRDVRAPARVLGVWDARNSRVTLEPIDLDGRPTGPARLCTWPLQIDGRQQLRLHHRDTPPPDRPEMQLVFLDEAGRPLFEACYEDPASVSAPPAGG
jgi:hypothetical protein